MHPDQAAIDRIFARTRRIAVVGLSDRPHRTSHGVTRSMQRRGYDIVPVNPTIREALGEPAHASLADVPGELELVNVFRRQEHVDEVVREAIAAGATAVWLQQGLRSATARRLAAEAGVDYVEDACIAVLASLADARPPRDAADEAAA